MAPSAVTDHKAEATLEQTAGFTLRAGLLGNTSARSARQHSTAAGAATIARGYAAAAPAGQLNSSAAAGRSSVFVRREK